MRRVIGIMAGLAASLAAASAACSVEFGVEEPTSTASPGTAASPVPTEENGWVAYDNYELGVSLSHPPEWTLWGADDHTAVFGVPDAGPQAQPVFYLTRLLPTLVGDEGYQSVHGFIPEDIYQHIFGLMPGEEVIIAATFQNPDYSIFTRLEDTAVDGYTAAVIENDQLWEQLPGTREQRVLVEVGDRRYVFGATYFVSEARAAFDALLGTVEFTR